MISLALLLIPGIIFRYVTSRMRYAPVVRLMEQIKGTVEIMELQPEIKETN